MLKAFWLHEAKLNVPAVQVAVWLLLWLIDDDAVALVDGSLVDVDVDGSLPPVYACAAETALPLLKFTANWLHEPVLSLPAVQVAV